MSASIQKAYDQFERMSPREQRLAIIVAVLVTLFLIFAVVRTALGSLATLDAQVNRLQQNILNVKNQIRHRERTEAQYARVASQHSSAWTEAEILDRLRAEIYRLAQRQPPPLDEKGVPVEVTNSQGELVTIPTIQQGNLSEGEQGYREYNLSFSVPEAPLQDLVDFVDRLQNSPQSLRVDAIELVRDPVGEKVAANLTITRTIVAGISGGVTAAPVAVAKAEENADAAPKGMRLNAAEWKVENCTIAAEPEKGEATALIITPTEAGATAYIERVMPPGVYNVDLEVATRGPATLAVADSGKPLEGALALAPGDAPVRVRFQFHTASAERAPLRLPLFTMAGPESTLRITRIALEKAGE